MKCNMLKLNNELQSSLCSNHNTNTFAEQSLQVGGTCENVTQNSKFKSMQLVWMHSDEHITPVLHYLYWFPVEVRVDYKVLLRRLIIMCRLTLVNEWPFEWMTAVKLVKLDNQVWAKKNLKIKRMLVGYGARSFSYAAAVLLNDLCDRIWLCCWI